ncbi:DUF2339 domain-containing protein [Microbulbifer sp. ALW1]|uniref:DUF2339 domain-containing protein n=1 Tax=Microbulbifer sp. (strain ALW1) TaxID=1516059 RepID=UPI001356FAE5|nr:DUF2339 domain-containing protein [Microbulbifer sp. ALW1]
MDGFVLLGLLLILTVIVGSLLGIVAFVEVKSLRQELSRLRKAVDATASVDVSEAVKEQPPPVQPPAPSSEVPGTNSTGTSATGTSSTEIFASPKVQAGRAHTHIPTPAPTSSALRKQRTRKELQPQPRKHSLFLSRLQENWMVWLGGACVALAGVFLARYGIEQGLLGPKVRVALGLATALALYLASEYLRRRTGASHPTFAALAGGGAITAFAAILSALHLYHLFEPGLAFGLLAVVALVTMWLARLHGPVLAAIGMLGAYSVPALVSSGGGNVLGAMLYALIITASVLLLLRRVYRTWLWLGLMLGALAWWLISLAGHQADGWRGPYLAVLAYLLLSLVPGDWLLLGKPGRSRGSVTSGVERAASSSAPAVAIVPLLLPSLLVVIAAQCLSILREGEQVGALTTALWVWSPLVVVILLAARGRANFALLSWGLLLGQLAAWLAVRLYLDGGNEIRLSPWPAADQGPFLLYLGGTALLFSGGALAHFRAGLARYWWASLAVMAPLLSLLLGYLLAAEYLPRYWWCLYAAVLGAIFAYLGSLGATRAWPKAMVVWLFVAGHFGYSLAVCLWLEQASLTLALALQAVSLAWIIRRFQVPALGWLLKGVLLLVVVRLTFNPWLLSYGEGSHWSLWTYGGSALCAWLAAVMLRSGNEPRGSNDPLANLANWAEAAFLHLLVLALWAECRYWLYGGNAFAAEFSFTEAVINIWLFAGLGLVYYRKSLLGGSFARWYDGYARLLMLASLACYLRILFAVADSQAWAWQAIGERPVFNLLLPAFAGPALLALLVRRFYLPTCRKFATLLSALAAFVWVSLEIRHLWQGDIRLNTGTSTGELYTYSAVWLLLAVTAILLGSWRGWRNCYQGGMAVLALVIVKLFLVDMSGLEGLLRVASFMGLGLALLGIAYLHQKLSVARDAFDRGD